MDSTEPEANCDKKPSSRSTINCDDEEEEEQDDCDGYSRQEQGEQPTTTTTTTTSSAVPRPCPPITRMQQQQQQQQQQPSDNDIVFPVEPVVIQVVPPVKGLMNHSYRDFSLVPPPHVPHQPPPTLRIDDMSFAQKVHHILHQSDAYNNCISWMPHGRAFKVHKPAMFEKMVCQRYFGHHRYSSFLRDLNNYSFKHISKGVDRNCYYHEFMLRGRFHLCQYMPKVKDARRRVADPDHEPDFYHIDKLFPMKDNNEYYEEKQEETSGADTGAGIDGATATASDGGDDSNINNTHHHDEKKGMDTSQTPGVIVQIVAAVAKKTKSKRAAAAAAAAAATQSSPAMLPSIAHSPSVASTSSNGSAFTVADYIALSNAALAAAPISGAVAPLSPLSFYPPASMTRRAPHYPPAALSAEAAMLMARAPPAAAGARVLSCKW